MKHQPDSSRRKEQSVIAQLLTVASPPPLFVSIFALVAKVLTVVVACGVVLFGVGWARIEHGRRLAKAISVKENSATMMLLAVLAALALSALVAFLVFRLGSRRWVKVRVS